MIPGLSAVPDEFFYFGDFQTVNLFHAVSKIGRVQNICPQRCVYIYKHFVYSVFLLYAEKVDAL